MTTDNFERLSVDLNESDYDQGRTTTKNLIDADNKSSSDYQYKNTGTYNKFDNIIGQKYFKRDTFTPPFLKGRQSEEDNQEEQIV